MAHIIWTLKFGSSWPSLIDYIAELKVVESTEMPNLFSSQIKEFDDNGWAVIHHMVAAEKPLLNQVRIFCDADKNLLDLQTRDQYKYTPLLLAWL